MNCQQAWEAMSAALDHELPARERGMLETHLRGCDDCRARQTELEAVDRVLRAPAGRRLAAPARLRAQVEALAPAPARPRSRLGFGLALAGAALAGALLVLLIRRPAPIAFIGPRPRSSWWIAPATASGARLARACSRERRCRPPTCPSRWRCRGARG